MRSTAGSHTPLLASVQHRGAYRYTPILPCKFSYKVSYSSIFRIFTHRQMDAARSASVFRCTVLRCQYPTVQNSFTDSSLRLHFSSLTEVARYSPVRAEVVLSRL